ncbi:MAG: type 4a pilus biogenesis protein PilO [Actinomycetota bacterium]|nr:type 4a pilus biogenesis protein PilO [Actinomycetota bacterium]MDI6821392.1 type 4a pilus biogenesis protein PilO [Actinomycetota bacterium]
MTISLKSRITAVGIFAILLVVAFFLLAWLPQQNRKAQIRKQMEEERKRQETAKSTLSRLKAAKEESAQIESKLLSLSKRIPKEPELPSLIIELQDIATQAGIDFISIKPSVLSPKESFSEIPLSINITGGFFDVVDFLYRLEGLPREIKVNVVSISVKEYPELSVDISASAFTLIKPQQASESGKSQTSKSGG